MEENASRTPQSGRPGGSVGIAPTKKTSTLVNERIEPISLSPGTVSNKTSGQSAAIHLFDNLLYLHRLPRLGPDFTHTSSIRARLHTNNKRKQKQDKYDYKMK